jgi:hypothetical protein
MSKDKYFGNHSIDSKALSITSDGGLDLAEIGSSNPVNIASGNSVVVKLGDNGGVQKLYIQDSGGIEQASINSNGVISGLALYADIIECNNLDVGSITVPSGGLDLSSLDLEVSTLEVGGGYGSTGATINQHGAVSIDGDLTVDEQVFLNHEGIGAKRSKVWIGYEMLQVFDVVNHWGGALPVSPGTAYGMYHSYSSETLHISLDDLPNEAVITSMGFSIYFNTMSSGGNATIILKLQALELPLGIAPTITQVGSVQIREYDLNAAEKPGWHIATVNLNEDRSSTPLNIKSYQLDLLLHNGGAAQSIILNGIWVNYVIPNLTPAYY